MAWSRQGFVLVSNWDFVDNSIPSMDQKGLDLTDKVMNLQINLIEEMNFTNNIRQILKWETELLETGMWIQNFAEHIRRRQGIFTTV